MKITFFFFLRILRSFFCLFLRRKKKDREREKYINYFLAVRGLRTVNSKYLFPYISLQNIFSGIWHLSSHAAQRKPFAKLVRKVVDSERLFLLYPTIPL